MVNHSDTIYIAFAIGEKKTYFLETLSMRKKKLTFLKYKIDVVNLLFHILGLHQDLPRGRAARTKIYASGLLLQLW